MSKQLFIGSLLILFLLPLNVFSQEKTQPMKGTLIITSEMLTADNNAHTALFERSVVARTTDRTLYADRMLVTYDPDTGDITEVEAEGGVKFIKATSKGTRVVTSEKANYYADEDKVIFTGEPRATDGENVSIGDKITYFVKEDRYLVENSKAFVKKKKEQ